MAEQKDGWTPDGAFFVENGEKFGITQDGQTVCVGSVPRPSETPQDAQNPVAKLPTKGIGRELPQQPLKTAVMQHPGGRPKKEGSVHRTTKWRREKQGVLL